MICVFAPYDRSEVTAAAIRLADLITTAGEEVRLVALGSVESGIHKYWDRHLWSSRDKGIYVAGRQASTCIHFQPSSLIMKMLDLVAENARHILIPQWHQFHGETAESLERYDAIICPTKRCGAGINDALYGSTKPSKLSWARFTSGLQPVSRESHAPSIRLCVFANHTTVDFCGSLVLRTIAELLLSCERVIVTLLYNKTWPEQDRKELKRLLKQHHGRFLARYGRGLADQSDEFHNNDWVVIPSVRADFGIVASRALACGAAVIAHDIEPFSEIITNNHNGLLVQCEVHDNNKLHAPTAIPSLANMLSMLQRAATERRLLLALREADWHLDRQDAQFDAYWKSVLGIGD